MRPSPDIFRSATIARKASSQASPQRGAVLFAGGGTGGHIFPSIAIHERMREADASCDAHFLISTRPLDQTIIEKHGGTWTACGVKPLSVRPWKWPGFLAAWFRAVKQVHQVIEEHQIRAIVAMGGFVSGPAVAAGRKAGLPVALVNLDAVPGIANRHMSRKATTVFSVYDSDEMIGALPIGLPLRRSAVGMRVNGAPRNFEKHDARRALGLHEDKQTLLIVGGSQGAESINRAMSDCLSRDAHRRTMGHWQVLHICGQKNYQQVRARYEQAGIKVSDADAPANGAMVKLMGFCDMMGAAWTAADVAISRSGAGSVAEAWANRTPTIFLPYPFHRDDHQRLNAVALAEVGGAVLLKDCVDPKANADRLSKPLLALASDQTKRHAMVETMAAHEPSDGAIAVARWITSRTTGE